MLILARLAVTPIQLSICRTREFEADADGARLSGDPLALTSALQKIEASGRHLFLTPHQRQHILRKDTL